MEYWFLGLAALLAGLVDAVVGGGGLLQIPALLSGFPRADLSSLFATNKCASVVGTARAAWRFGQLSRPDPQVTLVAMALAFSSSALGASLVSLVQRAWADPVIFLVLLALTIWTLRDPQRGLATTPGIPHGHRLLWLGLGSILIGFYDGLFGPGTGTFLIFWFVRFLGYDFFRASVLGKFVNLASNLGALLVFLPSTAVLLELAVLMAACNFVGASLGVHLARRGGARFVRQVFVLVLLGLMSRFGWSLWCAYSPV